MDGMLLPKKYHKRVYVELHENKAHLGRDKVVELARTMLLLAIHESRHYTLCHKSVPLPQTAETCDSR